MPTFSFGCDFMMGLGKPQLCITFEVAIASAVPEILRGSPKFRGAPLAQNHIQFFF